MFRIHDDQSLDSGSEEQTAQFVAFFPTNKKRDHVQRMTLYEQHEMMLRKYPKSKLEINAIAYSYGLILLEDDEPYIPCYNRYLMFFQPEQDNHPNPAINAFCASLAAAKKG